MGQDLVSIIVEGFHVWRKNTVLAAPHILSLAVFVIVISLAGIVTLASFVVLKLWGFLVAILMGLGVAIILMFTPSYFSVAAIEMSARAVGGERVGLMDALKPKMSNVKRVFLINLTTGFFLFFVGMVFLGVQLIAHVDLVLPLSMVSGCILMFAPYYAVLSTKGWTECIRESYEAFMRNKVSVFLLVAFTAYIGFLDNVFLLPIALLAGAFIAPIGYPISAYQGGLWMTLLVVALGTFVIYIIAAVIFAVTVMAPLGVLWQLGLYRRLQR